MNLFGPVEPVEPVIIPVEPVIILVDPVEPVIIPIEPIKPNIIPMGKSRLFKQAFGTDTLIEKFNKPVLEHIIKNWDDYKDKIIDIDDNGEKSNYEPKIIIKNYLKKSNRWFSNSCDIAFN